MEVKLHQEGYHGVKHKQIRKQIELKNEGIEVRRLAMCCGGTKVNIDDLALITSPNSENITNDDFISIQIPKKYFNVNTCFNFRDMFTKISDATSQLNSQFMKQRKQNESKQYLYQIEDITTNQNDEAEEAKIDQIQQVAEDSQFQYIFAFAVGCLVVWNFDSAAEEDKVFELMDVFFEERITNNEQFQVDRLNYVYGVEIAQRYTVSEDSLILGNKLILFNTSLEEQTALSFACAQSIKLATYETELNIMIKENQDISLGRVKRTFFNREEITQKFAQIYLVKSRVYLESHLLQPPEYLWQLSDENREDYLGLFNYFEMNQRVNIINDKLNGLNDMLHAIKEENAQSYSFYLSQIVAALVAAHLIAVMIAEIIKYYHHSSDHESGGLDQGQEEHAHRFNAGFISIIRYIIKNIE